MKHSKMIAAKRIAVAVAAVCATMSAPAFAADAKSLLDLMLKKGVITQAEYDEYMKSDAYENQQFKDQRIDADVSKSIKFIQKREKDGSVKEGGFGLVSGNGEHEINLTGRVHFDTRYIDSDFAKGDYFDKDSGSNSNNFEIRRARIGVNGKVFKDIGYEIIANAVGSNANLIDTAWMNYGYNPQAQVRFGRFKQPFSLEELTSSNNIDFMERSYVNQLVPGKRLGVMLHGIPSTGYTYGVSLYQADFGQPAAEGGYEGAARLTANLAQITGQSNMVMHFGFGATSGSATIIPTTSSSGCADNNAECSTFGTILGLRSEARGLNNVLRVRQQGQNARDGYSAPSPSGTKVNRTNMGLEAAFAYDSLKFQAEMLQADIKAQNYTDLDVANGAALKGQVKASYVEAVYNLTGEKWSENYSNGAFGSLKIKNNFNPSGSGLGAWQVGIRYSWYDGTDLYNNSVNSTDIRGGSPKGNTTTLGLTWFINPNSRIMLNYATTRFGSAFTAVDVNGPSAQREDVIALRTQFNF